MDEGQCSSHLPIQVTVGVSEPWEYDGPNPFRAQMTQVQILSHYSPHRTDVHETALLVVDKPFSYQGMKCQYFLASPRYEGTRICQVVKGDSFSVSLERISSARGEAENPFIPVKSLGVHSEKSFGLIGTIQMASTDQSQSTTNPARTR